MADTTSTLILSASIGFYVQFIFILFCFSITEPVRLSVETFYNRTVEVRFGGDHQWALFITLNLAASASYFALTIPFTLMDILQLFGYRKIRDPTKLKLKWSDLGTASYSSLRNLLIGGIFVYVVLNFKFYVLQIKVRTRVPTLSFFALNWFMFCLIRETVFYHVHRLLHWPKLYKRFHAQHHEWKQPIALATLDCTVVEHLATNVFSAMGPILINAHALESALWATYIMAFSVYAHSGYQLPYIPLSAAFHDYHHLMRSQNYGINGLFDRLYNTDNSFKKSYHYQLEKGTFSLLNVCETLKHAIYRLCSSFVKL